MPDYNLQQAGALFGVFSGLAEYGKQIREEKKESRDAAFTMWQKLLTDEDYIQINPDREYKRGMTVADVRRSFRLKTPDEKNNGRRLGADIPYDAEQASYWKSWIGLPDDGKPITPKMVDATMERNKMQANLFFKQADLDLKRDKLSIETLEGYWQMDPKTLADVVNDPDTNKAFQRTLELGYKSGNVVFQEYVKGIRERVIDISKGIYTKKALNVQFTPKEGGAPKNIVIDKGTDGGKKGGTVLDYIKKNPSYDELKSKPKFKDLSREEIIDLYDKAGIPQEQIRNLPPPTEGALPQEMQPIPGQRGTTLASNSQGMGSIKPVGQIEQPAYANTTASTQNIGVSNQNQIKPKTYFEAKAWKLASNIRRG